MKKLKAKKKNSLLDVPEKENLKLLLGLGNPGREYKWTRHNIGFIFIDRIASRYPFKKEGVNHLTWWGKVDIGAQEVLLAKPLTFMNLSGQAATWLISHFRLLPSQILIIHDDLDIPWGKFKLVRKGGAGGHKGVLSVQTHLGTIDIPRLKIGIGRASSDTVNYVLGQFTNIEREELEIIMKYAEKAVEVSLTEGLDKAMSIFNAKDFISTNFKLASL